MILIIIGLPLLLLWLYADEKTKNQRKTTDATLEAFACPCKMIDRYLLSAEICMLHYYEKKSSNRSFDKFSTIRSKKR